MAYVQWLNERSSEVRTTLSLPVRMIISDRKTAILPSNPLQEAEGIVIHRDPSVVVALQAMFEMVWVSASPLGSTFPSSGDYITPDERVALDLLALGHSSQDVADRMQISLRTAKRRIEVVKSKLDSDTLFQTAYKAVKTGWL
jgi:DNA-binding CsgD family transcriptional regulator